MPSFFVPGHHGLPTPPHVNGGRMEDPSFYPVGHAGFPPRYHQSGNEFIEQYSQSLCYGKPTSMNLHPQSAHPMNTARDHHHMMNQQPMFNPMVGAGLPSIRNVQLPPMDATIPPQYRRQEAAPMQQQLEQPRKEEKATGGVAAHLDYEMDRMSDFVAEMAQGIIYPGSSVPPPVSEIRLSDFVLDTPPKFYHSARSQVYRMLTVALLLGSKFLDDNTFQNKSWAEVSNIPVAELNHMELEWLFAFDWKIHDRIYDKQDGFASWRAHWDTWRTKATARAQESRQTLAPLETNVIRGQAVTKPLMSPEGPIPPQYQRSSQIENSWLNPTASEYSPPSTLSSGPTTPTTTRLALGVTPTRLRLRPTREAGTRPRSTWFIPHLDPSPHPTTTLRRMACRSLRVSGRVMVRPAAAPTVPSISSTICATVHSPPCTSQ
ncbi:hypothetical protein N7519_002829 [Penicillium mononematosum]|uniref:uncharacterized protein n=1 Tax=Penicillium mononematosum TaxID=268346 RepID=UPI002548742C|nr:uncharacterized protein N7519_002829 [Penicillium mononematosum]KAJ6187921.1 hypothetical protein N7519_002829 [Penicillium mononematosum]